MKLAETRLRVTFSVQTSRDHIVDFFLAMGVGVKSRP